MKTRLSCELDLFAAALRLSGSEREAYLARACHGDASLRQSVEALLKTHEESGGVLDRPAPMVPTRAIAQDVPCSEKPGDRIGRYKLLEKIGEGGCGVVYMAEQEEPVRRRVALKIIKLGLETKSVIATPVRDCR